MCYHLDFGITVHITVHGALPAGLWIRIHFLRIRIRIQSLMLEANTDPDPNPDPVPNPIRIQGLNDQKWKKITTENFFYFFLIKNCNLPIPRPQ